MSPVPAIVVKAAVPQDFDAIIDLVAGMFQDLGTTVFPDAWHHDLQQAWHRGFGVTSRHL